MFVKFVGWIAFVAAGLVFACAAPVHAEWWEAESAHFVVKSEASEVDTRRYALELEQFDRVLRLLQGMPTDSEDVGRTNKPTIYRYGRSVDIARIYGAPESTVAGFFIPRAGDSVGFAPTRNDRITSNPRPLIDYYLSYVRTGEAPTEIAVTALETAYTYAGSGLRLSTTRHIPVATRQQA